MAKIFALIMLFVMLFSVNAGSCKYGRPACVASCMFQSCATGYCYPENASPEKQTCKCPKSRCASYPKWPITK